MARKDYSEEENFIYSSIAKNMQEFQDARHYSDEVMAEKRHVTLETYRKRLKYFCTGLTGADFYKLYNEEGISLDRLIGLKDGPLFIDQEKSNPQIDYEIRCENLCYNIETTQPASFKGLLARILLPWCAKWLKEEAEERKAREK